MEQTLNQSEAFFLKYKKAIIAVVLALIVIIVGAVLYKTYISEPREQKASTAIAKGPESRRLLPPLPRVRIISHRVSSSRHSRATAQATKALRNSPTSIAQRLLVTWPTSMLVSAMPSWVSGRQLRSSWRLMMVSMMRWYLLLP